MLVSSKSVKTNEDLEGALLWDSPHSAPQRHIQCSHTQLQGKKKKKNSKSLVPQKTAALERQAGDAGEDKKRLDTVLTEKMAALPEQAAKQTQ